MYGPKWPFYSFLSVCGPGVVGVKCWDRLCILGRAPCTKETLGYPTSTNIPRVDGLSTRHLDFRASQNPNLAL